LKKQEDIDGYVLNMIKAYFRTTNKQGLNLDSKFEDHGLDSLDSIELAMQVEEDLGYIISAETLPVLNKVKHISNYIKHVE
jgi:acyl carrier protein